jgi:hypothetical protein
MLEIAFFQEYSDKYIGLKSRILGQMLLSGPGEGNKRDLQVLTNLSSTRLVSSFNNISEEND